jgi:5'-AMP-activated protein kinase, catalytic alpha subunit
VVMYGPHRSLDPANTLQLLDWVNKRAPLSEKDASVLFLQLVNAVEYAHRSGVVHRDIKLDNIFVTSDEQLLLGDWGYSTTWSNNSHHQASVGSSKIWLFLLLL